MSLTDLATSFGLGLVASGNPCVIPLYPGFMAYLSSRTQRLSSRSTESLLGLLVVLGVVSAMLAIGGFVTAAKIPATGFLRYATPAVDGFLIALGTILIVGWQPWARIRPPRLPQVANPLLEAFLYGTLFGPITVPCNLPLLLSAFAFSLTTVDLLGGIYIFFIFGLGLGVPLIVLSMTARAQKERFIRLLTKRHRQMGILAGLALVGIGVYDLILITQFLAILV